MRTTILLLTLGLVGCGGSGNQITVGGNSMTIRDEGYFYSDTPDYCPAGGAGQMMLDFVDYNYICDPSHAPDKAANAPHYELRIILTQGAAPDHATHPNMGLPYDNDPSVTPNCQTGPGDVIVGEFLHYPDGNQGTQPDMVQYASTAHLQFTSFDPTKAKADTGNYDLHFGGSEVKGSFTIFNCN
ncbi:MAG TPA: hypothetical protein VN947_02315 [Polyangia bacterium]|nr:hypothetical protein [Polyangia bacterium]